MLKVYHSNSMVEEAVYSAVEEWLSTIDGDNLLDVTKQMLEEGDGLEGVAEEFMSNTMSIEELGEMIMDNLNDLVEKLYIEINVEFPR
jgi:hypothetical protein